MKKIFTIASILISFMTFGQRSQHGQTAWLIKPSFGYQMPGGDMKEHFKSNFTIGLGVSYKTRTNWDFGIDGQYLFNDKINQPEQLLGAVLTDRGYILNGGGNYASVSVLQRGYYFTGDVGKTLKFWNINANSGPDIRFGAGFIRHWIRIENAGNDSPQILEPYTDGYDHLSGGFLLKQSIGYTYLSRGRRINMRLSFEVLEGFTQNLRGFDYSTGRASSGSKFDLLYGFRFQWILPIYQSASNDTFFYD